METLATIILLTPILLPVVVALGVDPIHFGILLVITSEIGFLTPPLGVNLFVAMSFLETLGSLQMQTDELRMLYEGKDGINRNLLIQSDPSANQHDGTTAIFHISLESRQPHTIRLSLLLEQSQSPQNGARQSSHCSSFKQHESAVEEHATNWMKEITHVSGNGSALDQLMERSFRSLRVLRSHLGKDAYFAAGVPWFVTLFGRDSLITALQMLAYHPPIAEQTLRLLAQYQGTREDEERDEQPGKILHADLQARRSA